MTDELINELKKLLKKVYFKKILEQKEIVLLLVLAEEFIETEGHNYPDKIEEVVNVKNYFEKRLKQINGRTN